MKQKELTNKMLSWGKRTMQSLHDSFGFDFNKPYYIEQGTTPFTPTQVIPKDIYRNAKEYEIVVLLKVGYYHTLYVAEYRWMDSKFISNDLFSLSYSLSHTYTAKDWENYRKSTYPRYEFFVIIQAKSLLSARKRKAEREATTSERYFVQDVYYSPYYVTNERYLHTLYLSDTAGKSVTYSTDVRNFGRTCQELDVIDKSGYLLELFRQELRNRVETTKANRIKRKYLATDNSGWLKLCEQLFEIKRNQVLDFAKVATTAKELDRLSDLYGYWGLRGVRERLDDVTNKERNKEYKSNEEFNEAYKSLWERLNKISVENT